MACVATLPPLFLFLLLDFSSDHSERIESIIVSIKIDPI